MTTYKVVVDGSNIATEGRSLPSLTQLDEAVQAFIEEHPGADVLVIVDSSFPNRIDQKELAIFEAAYAAGEIITPPAGTIGRGDSFILKVADKLGATVFSNDSFQEFHGTYDWLFEKGRLEGGKPIPGYGWVFTPRTPVRGPKSREAVRESKRSVARIGSPEAMRPMPVPKAPPPFLVKAEANVVAAETVGGEGRTEGRSGRGEVRRNENRRNAQSARAELRIDVDSDSERKKKKKKRKRKGGNGVNGVNGVNGSGAPEAVVLDLPAVNEPLAFINFIAQHLLGSELEGVVSSYSSHGFYVDAAGARCYVPLHGLAEPMPRSAKEVVRKGNSYNWIVTAFDSTRRGIELALVGTPAALQFAATGVAEPLSGDDGDLTAEAFGDAAAVEASAKSGRDAKSGRRSKPGRGRRPASDAVAVAEAPAAVEADAAAKPAKAGRGKRGKATPVDAVASAAVAASPVTESKAAKPAKAAKPVKGRAAKATEAPSLFDAAPEAAAKASAKAPAKTAAKAMAKRGAAKTSPAEAQAPAPVAKAPAKASTKAPAKAAKAAAKAPAAKAPAAKASATPAKAAAKASSAKAGAPVTKAPAKAATPAKAVAAKSAAAKPSAKPAAKAAAPAKATAARSAAKSTPAKATAKAPAKSAAKAAAAPAKAATKKSAKKSA